MFSVQIFVPCLVMMIFNVITRRCFLMIVISMRSNGTSIKKCVMIMAIIFAI